MHNYFPCKAGADFIIIYGTTDPSFSGVPYTCSGGRNVLTDRTNEVNFSPVGVEEGFFLYI